MAMTSFFVENMEISRYISEKYWEHTLYTPSQEMIVKVGSNNVIHPDGSINMGNMDKIAHQGFRLRQEGVMFKVVTSGAVGRGKGFILGYDGSDEMRRIAAKIGQKDIMHAWESIFNKYELPVSEWLLSDRDLLDPYFLTELHKASEYTIPIINGNDACNPPDAYVANNDNLAVGLAKASTTTDTVLLCTNTPGVLDRNGQVVPVIEPHRTDYEIEFNGKSKYGTGGMAEKDRAARWGAKEGIRVAICSLEEQDVIYRAAQGERVGTTYSPHVYPSTRRKM